MLVSYKTIGHNIRNARRESGFTQEQTAEKLKMSQLHFGRLERGERPASLEQLAQVSRVLNTPLSALLSGCIVEEDFVSAPDESAQELGSAVSHLAVGCTPKARRLMLSLCRAVAASDKLPDEENAEEE